MKKARGFTLVELVVAIAVVGILLGTAVPGFLSLVKNNRLTGQINALQGSFLQARSEAIKRKTSIKVCSSGNPNAAEPTCLSTGSEDWSQGWIIVEADTPTNIVGRSPDMEGGNSLCGKGAVVSGVQYTASGEVRDSGKFFLCDDRGADDGRAVIISSVGYSETFNAKTNDTTTLPDNTELTCDCS